MTEIENYKSALFRMFKDYKESAQDNLLWLQNNSTDNEEAIAFLRGKLSAYREILNELSNI